MPKVFRALLVLLLLTPLGACLSLTSRSQSVSLSTTPDHKRDFFLADEPGRLLTAPLFVEINRESHLRLVDEKTFQPFEVECSLRLWTWTISNLPLLVISYPFPGAGFALGLLTDWGTGSAYECPDVRVKLGARADPKDERTCVPTLVLNRSSLSNRELPRLIARVGRTAKPVGQACASHLHGEQGHWFLERYSLDYDEASALEDLERETLNEIGLETESDRILFIAGFDSTFTYELFDLHRKSVIAKGVLQYEPVEETSALWTYTRHFFRLIPNTLTFGASTLSLSDLEAEKRYESFESGSFGGRILLDYLYHPYTLGAFDVSFYVSSPLRLYSFRYEGDPFLDDPELRERFGSELTTLPTTLEMLYLGLGIGPAIEINTPIGQLGTALRFGGGYLDLKNSQGRSGSGWVTDWDFSLYYNFFVLRSFLVGLNASVLTFNRPAVDTAFMTVRNLSSVNLYLGYYFGDLRSYF